MATTARRPISPAPPTFPAPGVAAALQRAAATAGDPGGVRPLTGHELTLPGDDPNASWFRRYPMRDADVRPSPANATALAASATPALTRKSVV